MILRRGRRPPLQSQVRPCHHRSLHRHRYLSRTLRFRTRWRRRVHLGYLDRCDRCLEQVLGLTEQRTSAMFVSHRYCVGIIMEPTSREISFCSPCSPSVLGFRSRPCRAAIASTEAFSCLIDSRGGCTVAPAQKICNAPPFVSADGDDLAWTALVLAGRVLKSARTLLRR